MIQDMKLKVKLYGTLGDHIPGHKASEGMEVEIPNEASVKNLLDLLEISESRAGVLVVEGRILKRDDRIPPGVEVSIFQTVHGG